MSVAVQRHDNNPPLTFEGADGQQLVIQTGTIIFDLHSDPQDEDWSRDRLTHPILKLPLNTIALSNSHILAIASAAPSSMSYTPPNSVRVLGGGWGGGGETVEVIGDDGTPYWRPTRQIPLLGAGWAVDKTYATHKRNDIELVVDLAIYGHCDLMRLAYSVFVTIIPVATADISLPPVVHP